MYVSVNQCLLHLCSDSDPPTARKSGSVLVLHHECTILVAKMGDPPDLGVIKNRVHNCILVCVKGSLNWQFAFLTPFVRSHAAIGQSHAGGRNVLLQWWWRKWHSPKWRSRLLRSEPHKWDCTRCSRPIFPLVLGCGVGLVRDSEQSIGRLIFCCISFAGCAYVY